MKRKLICAALAGLFLAVSFPAGAQQTVKIPRISFLDGGTASVSAVLARANKVMRQEDHAE